MKLTFGKIWSTRSRRAFSLVEAITVVAIVSMVMVLAIQVYARVRRTATSIDSRLDKHSLPVEICQRIAEDLDRLAAPGYDTVVTVRNKDRDGLNISQLVIENRYYGSGDNPRPQTYEKVIWQTDVDPFDNTLILYRAHRGLKLEDPMLDTDLIGEPKPNVEKFSQVCNGLTIFDIQVPTEDAFLTQWIRPQMPKAIVVTISTAAPVEDEFGELFIPESDIITRTIAIDRTRKVPFKIENANFDPDELSSADPNEIDNPSGDAASDPGVGDVTGEIENTQGDDSGSGTFPAESEGRRR